MRSRFLYIIICCAMVVQGQEVLTLDSCLNLARENNHALRSAQYEVEQAEQVKKQAFTKYFPQVQGTAIGYASIDPWISVGIDDVENATVRDVLNFLYSQFGETLGLKNPYNFIQNGYSVGVSAIQPIYMGGKIVAGNKLAKVGIEAAELKQQVAERDKLLEVEESYWLCVGLEKKRATIEAATEMLDTIYKAVSAAANAGLAMPADLLKVELKQSEIQSQALQLQNGIRLAKRALCQSVGIAYSDSLRLEDGGAGISGQSGQSRNSGNSGNSRQPVQPRQPDDSSARPETELLSLQVKAAQLEKRMSVADALPHVIAGGGYAYNKIFDDPAANGVAFVSVTVPLTGWWETSHKIKQHNLKIKQAEEQQAEMNEKMLLQQQQAYDHWSECASLTEQQQRALSTAEENYRLTEINYRAGLATITDLLQAHTTLLQTENALTDARLNTQVAERRYRALMCMTD